jgi:hypothetical protein
MFISLYLRSNGKARGKNKIVKTQKNNKQTKIKPKIITNKLLLKQKNIFFKVKGDGYNF